MINTTRRFLITGTPRSGNTVMKYLCALGYEDGWAGDEEDDPTGYEDNGMNMFFKLPMECQNIPAWLERGYQIIFMVRHPRGCFTSRGWRQEPGDPITPGRARRWNENAKLYLAEYKDNINVACVRYEDLIRGPNHLQQKLARQFDLKIRRPFTKCYLHKGELEDRPGLVGGLSVGVLRKIEPNKSRLFPTLTKQDTVYMRRALRQYPDIPELVKAFNYKQGVLK